MKTDTMKPKHWKSLFSKINIKKNYHEVTISELWGHDILRYEKAIDEV